MAFNTQISHDVPRFVAPFPLVKTEDGMSNLGCLVAFGSACQIYPLTNSKIMKPGLSDVRSMQCSFRPEHSFIDVETIRIHVQ